MHDFGWNHDDEIKLTGIALRIRGCNSRARVGVICRIMPPSQNRSNGNFPFLSGPRENFITAQPLSFILISLFSSLPQNAGI
jgi:hypothetical protein